MKKVNIYIRGFILGLLFEYLLRVRVEFFPVVIFILISLVAVLDIVSELPQGWTQKFRITGCPLMFLKKIKKSKSSNVDIKQ